MLGGSRGLRCNIGLQQTLTFRPEHDPLLAGISWASVNGSSPDSSLLVLDGVEGFADGAQSPMPCAADFFDSLQPLHANGLPCPVPLAPAPAHHLATQSTPATGS